MGFVCLTLPFVLLRRDKKKTWCKSYCPRASLFSVLFKGRSLTKRTAPKLLTNDRAKRIVLVYFCLNLFALVMSTTMVSIGRIDVIDKVRFLMAFQLPWDIPQLLNINDIPNWAVHLSFRIYSMMFSTTVVGLLLGWIYTPRTWCTICPINTISDISIKN